MSRRGRGRALPGPWALCAGVGAVTALALGALLLPERSPAAGGARAAASKASPRSSTPARTATSDQAPAGRTSRAPLERSPDAAPTQLSRAADRREPAPTPGGALLEVPAAAAAERRAPDGVAPAAASPVAGASLPAPATVTRGADREAALLERLERLERTVERLDRELRASRAELALGLRKDEPAAEALRDLLGAGRRPFHDVSPAGAGDEGLAELMEALEQAD